MRPSEGPAGERAAAVHQVEGRLVIEMLAKHGADQRDVIGAFAQMRQQLG